MVVEVGGERSCTFASFHFSATIVDVLLTTTTSTDINVLSYLSDFARRRRRKSASKLTRAIFDFRIESKSILLCGPGQPPLKCKIGVLVADSLGSQFTLPTLLLETSSTNKKYLCT